MRFAKSLTPEMDRDQEGEVSLNELNFQSSLREMDIDSDVEDIFPLARHSKCAITRVIDSESDVEEVFPNALNSKSTRTRQIDCNSDVEEVFPTALSSEMTSTQGTSPKLTSRRCLPMRTYFRLVQMASACSEFVAQSWKCSGIEDMLFLMQNLPGLQNNFVPHLARRQVGRV